MCWSVIKLNKEIKDARNQIRRLKAILRKKDKELAQKQADINKLHNDFMRLMDDNTIHVSVDDLGRIRELVRHTPYGFVIEKREKELS